MEGLLGVFSKSLPQVFHDRDHLDQGETVRARDLFVRWRRYARSARKLRLRTERKLATAEAKGVLGDRLRPWVAQEKKRDALVFLLTCARRRIRIKRRGFLSLKRVFCMKRVCARWLAVRFHDAFHRWKRRSKWPRVLPLRRRHAFRRGVLRLRAFTRASQIHSAAVRKARAAFRATAPALPGVRRGRYRPFLTASPTRLMFMLLQRAHQRRVHWHVCEHHAASCKKRAVAALRAWVSKAQTLHRSVALATAVGTSPWARRCSARVFSTFIKTVRWRTRTKVIAGLAELEIRKLLGHTLVRYWQHRVRQCVRLLVSFTRARVHRWSLIGRDALNMLRWWARRRVGDCTSARCARGAYRQCGLRAGWTAMRVLVERRRRDRYWGWETRASRGVGLIVGAGAGESGARACETSMALSPAGSVGSVDLACVNDDGDDDNDHGHDHGFGRVGYGGAGVGAVSPLLSPRLLAGAVGGSGRVEYAASPASLLSHSPSHSPSLLVSPLRSGGRRLNGSMLLLRSPLSPMVHPDGGGGTAVGTATLTHLLARSGLSLDLQLRRSGCGGRRSTDTAGSTSSATAASLLSTGFMGLAEEDWSRKVLADALCTLQERTRRGGRVRTCTRRHRRRLAKLLLRRWAVRAGVSVLPMPGGDASGEDGEGQEPWNRQQQQQKAVHDMGRNTHVHQPLIRRRDAAASDRIAQYSHIEAYLIQWRVWVARHAILVRARARAWGHHRTLLRRWGLVLWVARWRSRCSPLLRGRLDARLGGHKQRRALVRVACSAAALRRERVAMQLARVRSTTLSMLKGLRALWRFFEREQALRFKLRSFRCMHPPTLPQACGRVSQYTRTAVNVFEAWARRFTPYAKRVRRAGVHAAHLQARRDTATAMASWKRAWTTDVQRRLHCHRALTRMRFNASVAQDRWEVALAAAAPVTTTADHMGSRVHRLCRRSKAARSLVRLVLVDRTFRQWRHWVCGAQYARKNPGADLSRHLGTLLEDEAEAEDDRDTVETGSGGNTDVGLGRWGYLGQPPASFVGIIEFATDGEEGGGGGGGRSVFTSVAARLSRDSLGSGSGSGTGTGAGSSRQRKKASAYTSHEQQQQQWQRWQAPPLPASLPVPTTASISASVLSTPWHSDSAVQQSSHAGAHLVGSAAAAVAGHTPARPAATHAHAQSPERPGFGNLSPISMFTADNSPRGSQVHRHQHAAMALLSADRENDPPPYRSPEQHDGPDGPGRTPRVSLTNDGLRPPSLTIRTAPTADVAPVSPCPSDRRGTFNPTPLHEAFRGEARDGDGSARRPVASSPSPLMARPLPPPPPHQHHHHHHHDQHDGWAAQGTAATTTTTTGSYLRDFSRHVHVRGHKGSQVAVGMGVGSVSLELSTVSEAPSLFRGYGYANGFARSRRSER